MSLAYPNPPADPDTFAALFERHKNLVYKTAYLMLGDRAEAEDALQEVFVLVYRSLASFDPGKGAFTTWLYRITINHCLAHRRKRRLVFQPIDSEALAVQGESLESGLAKSAERETVAEAIQGLSEKQRAVVVLRYYWDLPYAEIAQILGIPLGTVKSRIDLTLRTLRQKLSGQGEERCLGSPSEMEAAHEL